MHKRMRSEHVEFNLSRFRLCLVPIALGPECIKGVPQRVWLCGRGGVSISGVEVGRHLRHGCRQSGRSLFVGI